MTATAMTDWQMGMVRWFDPSRHYGFVDSDAGGEAYLHIAAVQKNRIKPVDVMGGVRVRYRQRQVPGRRTPEITDLQLV